MRYHGELSVRSSKSAAGNAAMFPGARQHSAASGRSSGASSLPEARHLFGRPDPADRCSGFGTEAETEDLLSRLALLMVELGRGDPGAAVTLNIPAGYTYLAQLVGHDVVHHTTPLAAYEFNAPDLSGERRIEPLVLETIYGSGPLASPHIYAVPRARGLPRERLRLGAIQGAPLVNADEPPRDIPRIACPHLNDSAQGGARRDVLIGDPRNDDNLILSQLTVVFHLLHNLVVDRLITTREPWILEHLRADRQQIFLTARRVVSLIYRRIVVFDLLQRLLHGEVYKYYRPNDGNTPSLDESGHGSSDVPREFAFGAFRFGHAMVRRTYELNDKLGRTGLNDLLEQTSEGRARAMPLTADWLIEWSRFFDLRQEKTKFSFDFPLRAPDFSRKLGPSVVAPLDRAVEPDRAARGGLAFEDLRAGTAAGLHSVDFLAKRFRARVASDNIFPDCPLYSDRNARACFIRKWLQERADIVLQSELRLGGKHITELAKNPPLFFFVLLEADVVAGGDCLGPLGSLIVAESLFPLLKRKRALIEDDQEVNGIADHIFAQAQPRSMPELLLHLAEALDLARPEARFL